MRIALIGYGKMGKAIEPIAVGRGHSISAIINSNRKIEQLAAEDCDVAIEFTQPDLAMHHIEYCAEKRIPLVVGTTGWYDKYTEITNLVKQHSATLLAASNFSLGVNILFHVNKVLAKAMAMHKGYQASITEIHHTQKLDSPSGTAITLAEGILENNHNYQEWALAENKTNEMQLPILAERIASVPGTHHVYYKSEIDTITLSHEAHNRSGFALGSVVAAEYVVGKTGVFTMQDVLGI